MADSRESRNRTLGEAMPDTNADGSCTYRPLEEIEPGEAVDLCERLGAALRLARGEPFQDRDAWEKLARAIAKRFDAFAHSEKRTLAESMPDTNADGSYTYRPPTDAVPKSDAFRRDLALLLNQYSMENGSNTPDYMLADYLIQCLRALDATIKDREGWHGR